jgi:hypothetical protein
MEQVATEPALPGRLLDEHYHLRMAAAGGVDGPGQAPAGLEWFSMLVLFGGSASD